jgi:hypothetical protein
VPRRRAPRGPPTWISTGRCSVELRACGARSQQDPAFTSVRLMVPGASGSVGGTRSTGDPVRRWVARSLTCLHVTSRLGNTCPDTGLRWRSTAMSGHGDAAGSVCAMGSTGLASTTTTVYLAVIAAERNNPFWDVSPWRTPVPRRTGAVVTAEMVASAAPSRGGAVGAGAALDAAPGLGHGPVDRSTVAASRPARRVPRIRAGHRRGQCRPLPTQSRRPPAFLRIQAGTGGAEGGVHTRGHSGIGSHVKEHT